MFGKAHHLRPLELQKQLLVAESDLNRAQLSMDWEVLVAEVRGCAAKARTAAAWTSAAGLLATSLAAGRHSSVRAKREDPSWFQRVLRFAQLANSILQVFRAAPWPGGPRNLRPELDSLEK
jgi:hypothetical protein